MNPAAFAAIASFMRSAGPALGSEAFKSGAAMDIGASALQNTPKLFQQGEGTKRGPTSSFFSFGDMGGAGAGMSLASRAVTAPARKGLDIVNDIKDSVVSVGAEMASNKKQGAVISNVSGQLSSITTKAANVVSGSPQDALALAKEVAVMPARIRDWAEALKESQRQLSQFSGVLAGAIAESDIKQVMRDIRMANETASSGREQIVAFDELKDALFPVEKALTIGINDTMTAMSKEVTKLVNDYAPDIVGSIKLMAGFLKEMVKWLELIFIAVDYAVRNTIPFYLVGIYESTKMAAKMLGQMNKKASKAEEDVQVQAIQSLQAGFYSPKSTKP